MPQDWIPRREAAGEKNLTEPHFARLALLLLLLRTTRLLRIGGGPMHSLLPPPRFPFVRSLLRYVRSKRPRNLGIAKERGEGEAEKDMPADKRL